MLFLMAYAISLFDKLYTKLILILINHNQNITFYE